MAVAVVVLADEHARRLHPLVERVAADVLSAWHELLIFLAVEQRTKVVMQPSASVVTLVDDYRLAVTVLVA